MQFKNTQAFAQQLDTEDPLKDYRNRFQHPKLNGKSATYFCGNSLGLKSKTANEYVNQELVAESRRK